MKFSQGSALVLNVAALEAALTRCKSVEPEHLFLAMCKVTELPLESPGETPEVAAEVLERIKAEVGLIRATLERASVDTTQTRRRLRRLLEKDPSLLGHFTKQSSKACRDVCLSAESRALVMGDSKALPIHLLWALLSANRPLIRQAVGDSGGSWQKLCDACGASTPVDGHADHVGGAACEAPERAHGEFARPGPTLVKPKESPEANVAKDGQAQSPTPFLDKFGRDITALVCEGKLGGCIGRKDEMRALAQILTRKTKNNPVLVGEAGVGKTCIVEGLALRCARPDAPEAIRNWRFVEITMGALMAGAMYQGMLEERLQTMLREAASDNNLILFLDEIHTLVGAGGGHGKGLDAAQILKPALARGDIRLIGATTTGEYRKFIESDPALERRLEMVWVNEPTREEAIEILDGVRTQLEEHHGVLIAYNAIVRAVEWSLRYIPDRRLPDKALDIIDQACAAQIIKTLSPPEVDVGETFDMAVGNSKHITEEDIAKAISERCRIPVGAITTEDAERLIAMEDALKARVMGQDDAIKQVADAVRTARAGLKKPTRPLAVLLFLGATGTGKTELAKAIAEFIFGSEESLIRLDMSEYHEKHNVARLIGAPPGYIGHDEEGQLTGKVRTRPYCVILLDEIEKAHADVFDIFLQMFDDGRLTDSKGRRAVFTETIIVMTSNLGSSISASPKKQIGFHVDKSHDADQAVVADSSEAREKRIREELGKKFKPEFLNRIDRQIIFQPLTRDVVERILTKLIRQLNERLEEKRLTLDVSQDARDLIVEQGFSETYGARELERVFDELVATPLARAILEGQFRDGDHITAGILGGGIHFE